MTGFYELLQVAPDASPEALRAAYQEQVAQVVRRQRAAEARQGDTAPIEARRAALAEAWGVLSDPARRRRYDRFRELCKEGLPTDLDGLWARANASLVDPAAAAAVEVLKVLTDLRLGDRPPGAPARSAASHAAPSLAAPPAGIAPVMPPSPDADVPGIANLRPARVAVPGERITDVLPPRPAVVPVAPPAAATVAEPKLQASAPLRLVPTPPPAAPDAPPPREVAVNVVRAVTQEDLARLLDQFGPTGAFLGAVRELRNVRVEDLAERTRISQRFIESIERDAYAELPGAAFVRGYVRMMVTTLEAIPRINDTNEYVDGFMARYFRARG